MMFAEDFLAEWEERVITTLNSKHDFVFFR